MKLSECLLAEHAGIYRISNTRSKKPYIFVEYRSCGRVAEKCPPPRCPGPKSSKLWMC